MLHSKQNSAVVLDEGLLVENVEAIQVSPIQGEHDIVPDEPSEIGPEAGTYIILPFQRAGLRGKVEPREVRGYHHYLLPEIGYRTIENRWILR